MLRNWLMAGVLAGLAAAVLTVSAAARLGLVAVELQRPDTHWFWYVSRATGLCAYLALAASVVWGLLLSTGVADAWIARGRSLDVHRWISAIAIALVVGHAVALMGDPYVRFDAVDVLVPFASGYRKIAVAFGVVAGYGALAVFGSFWLRRQLGQRAWRLVHYVAFPTLGLVTLHGILAGSESTTAWMRLVYMATTALVLLLVIYRMLLWAQSRPLPRIKPAAAPPIGRPQPLPR